MKVLLINGSNKVNGTTNRALEEVAKSGYGAGLSQSVENDSEFYITVPSDSDMY